MSLRLLRTVPATPEAMWAIETPTPGVVLIDVAVGGAHSAVPLHWRVGTWAKPPLDVFFDEEGRLLGFQFVLQDERIPRAEWPLLPHAETATPIFDVENWPPERYLDETAAVTASRLSGEELSLRVGEPRQLTRACQVDVGLVVAFCGDGALAEMRLGPLPRDDWEAIDAFSLVE